MWYDNRASDLTKEGMLKGIEQAAAFMLFLSQGVLQRPFCQMEIRHALALKKPFVMIHGERRTYSAAAVAFDPLAHALAESDARHGGFDFREAHAAAPNDLKQVLDNTESLVSIPFLQYTPSSPPC